MAIDSQLSDHSHYTLLEDPLGFLIRVHNNMLDDIYYKDCIPYTHTGQIPTWPYGKLPWENPQQRCPPIDDTLLLRSQNNSTPTPSSRTQSFRGSQRMVTGQRTSRTYPIPS